MAAAPASFSLISALHTPRPGTFISCRGEREAIIIQPTPFSILEIDPNSIPCLQENRFREFTFTYDYTQTNGLAGVFRFLIPQNPDGKLCWVCWVESLFKMFIDPDGDFCLTPPDYKDERVSLEVNISGERWGEDELRGVFPKRQ